MGITLVTYLPCYRIHEVSEYFLRNVEVLRPKSVIAYVDNVYHERQKEILGKVMPGNVEVRFGNWRNRNDTWLTMLRDFSSVNGVVVVVDSDVALAKNFTEEFSKVFPLGKMIGVSDVRIGPGVRDVVINDVPHTRIVYYRHGHVPIFFGPNQAVIINHKVDADAVAVLERALHEVPVGIRNCIADEVILGLYALLIGQELTPWFNGAINEDRVRMDACNRHVRAYAHYKLFNALRRNEDLGKLAMKISVKYLLSALVN